MTDDPVCASNVRTRKKAARIRRKHQKTITEQVDQRTKLHRAWSWVLAELKANPAQTDTALEVVTDLAETLNERSHQ